MQNACTLDLVRQHRMLRPGHLCIRRAASAYQSVVWQQAIDWMAVRDLLLQIIVGCAACWHEIPNHAHQQLK